MKVVYWHLWWILSARRLTSLVKGAGSERGATALEFAMIAPAFLALLFGVMEGGRVIFTQSVLSYATQTTTRWAVVNPPASGQTQIEYEAELADYAKSKLIIVSPNKMVTSAATSPPDPSDNTRTITVTLSYDFEWMMPFVGTATGPFELSASSRGFLAENF